MQQWLPDDNGNASSLHPEPQFKTPGFCFVCQQWTEFMSSWDFAYRMDGHLQVNWREHLVCALCQLNNRRRASIHLLMEIVHPTRRSFIYATEHTSRVRSEMDKIIPRVFEMRT